MKVLADIPFKLDINDLLKQNNLKEGTDHAVEFKSLFDMAEKTGKPKAIFKECFIDKKGTEVVSIDGIAFKSHVLRKNLDSIERVFAYVVTCGKEVDAIEISQGDFLKEYWLDTIKQALLDFSRKYLDEYISQKYNVNKTASMQPGSGDVSVWPIEQQKELFLILGDVESLIGVKLTESSLMLPVKSISGIIYPTQVDFKSCQLCYRKKCPRRRIPFNKDLWETMQDNKKNLS
jgi:hypothetical protein